MTGMRRRAGSLLLAIGAVGPTLGHRLDAQTSDAAAVVDLIRARRWDEAAEAFARLTEANPYHGTLHYYRGAAEARRGECGVAVAPLRRAIALGVDGGSRGMRQARVVLAECAAATGDPATAMAQLDTAWRQHGLRDFGAIAATPALRSVIGLPRFREISGTPASPIGDPAARWPFDLDYLDRLVRETHPAPFRALPESEWAREVRRLREALPAMTDLQRTGALMRLVALVGDGHTALYPPLEGPGAWTLLPIFPIALADGWYVGAASPEHYELVGSRILGAGGAEMATLERAAHAILARDNEWTARWLAQIPLQTAEFYALAGAAEADGAVKLAVRRPGGDEARVRLVGAPVDRDPNARWAPPHWRSMGAAGFPRWIRYAGASASVEWLPEPRVLYVALNAIADTAGRPLAALGAALRDSIMVRDPAGLVLDLRLNNGGNGNLLPGFLAPLLGLPLLQRPGAFQVLTGPRSFSATGFLLGELERYTAAERVGWPTGVRPVVPATEAPFRLPLSGLHGSISARLEVKGRDAGDARPWFPPQTVAWPSGAQLGAGEDPVLDAALRRIAAAASPGRSR